MNVNEEDVKQGKKIFVSASLRCNAAKAYGSGKIIPWCSVKNSIDNIKYLLDAKGKSFVLNQDDILIGSTLFIIPIRKHVTPFLQIEAGYILDTGYTGIIEPVPRQLSEQITLNRFKDI